MVMLLLSSYLLSHGSSGPSEVRWLHQFEILDGLADMASASRAHRHKSRLLLLNQWNDNLRLFYVQEAIVLGFEALNEALELLLVV